MANKRTKNEAKRLGIRTTTGTKKRTEKSEKVLSSQVKKALARKKKISSKSTRSIKSCAVVLGTRGGVAKARNRKSSAKRTKPQTRRKSPFGRK